MDVDAFVDNDDELVKYRWKLCLSPQCWCDNYEVTLRFHDEDNWSGYIKYLNENNNELSEEIKNLPKDCGGIYVFSFKGKTCHFVSVI